MFQFALRAFYIFEYTGQLAVNKTRSMKIKIEKFLEMVTYRVHFEINEFTTGEGDDDLPLVYGTLDDRFFTRCFPLIHTFVSSDMTNAIGIYL